MGAANADENGNNYRLGIEFDARRGCHQSMG